MRKITECFDRQLTSIYQQIIQVEEVNILVKKFLPESLQSACQVSQFNLGHLTISISDVALATELRFFLPTLRDLLRQKARLHQLVSISISVSKLKLDKKDQPLIPKLSLSSAAKHAINEVSKICGHEPLQHAWKKMASQPSTTIGTKSESIED